MQAALASPAEREFVLTDDEFERVRRIIHSHAGISLADSKRELVYSRLARRLRSCRLDSFSDYLALLDDPQSPEWEAFTNALTTNLTSFFREVHHFEILRKFLASGAARRPAVIWCSACSTGEEPYSIAMAAAEAFGTAKPPVRILASDVDTNVLRKAQAGVYPAQALERMPREQAEAWFEPGSGVNAGKVRVREELRSLVVFRPLNLLQGCWPLRGPFDAIFCRNVMIYFDRPTQRTVLERFRPLLAPHGLLFVGHSESLHHAADLFRLRGKTVYAPSDRPSSRFGARG